MLAYKVDSVENHYPAYTINRFFQIKFEVISLRNYMCSLCHVIMVYIFIYINSCDILKRKYAAVQVL